MPDLAELGLRVRSEEAEIGADRLDDLAMAAGRAETAEEKLAAAARGTGSALAVQNVAVAQQQRVLMASRNAMGLTAQEGLNLSRQFSDIAVTAAMGMNPLMILIQQGPQIADVFQTAAARGVGFNAVLRSMLDSLKPLLAVLLPVGAAVGSAAAAFGLLNRELSKGYPDDITKGMGLTEEQLDRVKTKTVTMGDTFQATVNVIGRHLMDGPIGDGIDWLQEKLDAFLDWAGDAWVEGMAVQVGAAVGGYRAIVETYSLLPAALGEIVTNATNNVLRAVEELINGTIRRINLFITLANLVPGVALSRFSEVDLPEATQKFDGATAAIGNSFQENVTSAIDESRAALKGLGSEISAEAIRRARARALEEAGKPNKGREGGKSSAEREYERIMKAGEAYRLGLVKEREQLGMTAQERRTYEAQAQADILIKKGQTDAARALAGSILDEAEALSSATLAYEHREAMKRQGQDRQMLELERDLLGATNIERARQLAMLSKEIELRNSLGAAYVNSSAGQNEIFGAGNNAAFGAQTGMMKRPVDAMADELRMIDELARSAGRGLADSFGEAGKALDGLLGGLTTYQAALAEIARAEFDGQMTAAQAMRERGALQVQTYGDMAAAAKGFFEEGSTGYRLMMAIEQAYRLQQFAMAIQAMAISKAETAASVTDSATRGAASAASGAAKMFEALGPLGFPMVAAMIALLASLGLKSGGGASGSGKGKSTMSDSIATAQSFGSQATQARDSATTAMAGKMEVVVTADRDGLQAYVRSEAADVAAPMSRSAAQAGTVGGATTALSNMQSVQRRTFRLG